MSKPGDTAIRHAKAWLVSRYQDAPMLQARKFVVRQRGRTISLGEDLFGVFDFLVLPPDGVARLIQVTTMPPDPRAGGGSPPMRRRKVQDWIEATYPGVANHIAEVLVMAWVKGKHFRRWEWSWAQGEWNEISTVTSPLLKGST